MTTRTKVFVSYSHADKDVRDEVLRSLRAVPRINRVLWWDEEEIAISDKFHPKIQQGLAESRIGILLLSNYSFTSDYILRHELPYLIEHAETGDLKQRIFFSPGALLICPLPHAMRCGNSVLPLHSSGKTPPNRSNTRHGWCWPEPCS
jgi:hypothetical protein